MKAALHKGNIVRQNWPQSEEDPIPIYLGSGKAGACLDAWGLMNRPWQPAGPGSLPNTAYLHADHWHRGLYGLDMLLPVYQLGWSTTPEAPLHYRQELQLPESRLVTELAWKDLSIHMRLSFHPYKRNLLVLQFQYEARNGRVVPGLVLNPLVELVTQGYRQAVSGLAEAMSADFAETCLLTDLQIGTAHSRIALKVLEREGSCTLATHGGRMHIRFNGRKGDHLLLVGVCGISDVAGLLSHMNAIQGGEACWSELEEAWRKRYGDAYVSLSDDRHQALWSRSLHDLLSSFSPEAVCPVSPMGFSGNGWPFHFPQDMAYILPALLQLGHVDIAQGIVSYYRGCLSNMQAFTKRIYGVHGAQWAWEFPMDNQSNLLEEGTPNWFQFEIHNAAYPAFMAHETAKAVASVEWTREVAWPIILESARFFAAVLKQEDDGSWGIEITPSMGQDEWGGENAKNYFCALTSARYSLTVALRTATQLDIPLEDTDHWRTILEDGLAFKRLLHPKLGLHMTYEGNPDAFRLGRQKHPIQLSPVTFLPLDEPGEPEKIAYARRYDLSKGSDGHFFTGWSLATFWLAAARMGTGKDLETDLAQALPSGYVDPEWTVLFETSRHGNMPMYLTNHGLFMQAVHTALLREGGRGPSAPSGLPSSWKTAEYRNLRTSDGDMHSGTLS
jgi:hypothetical protein